MISDQSPLFFLCTYSSPPSLYISARRGSRAEYMTPAFPSVTFANHYSLVTGLYPESHGIIGNSFYDPILNASFYYKRPEDSWPSKWWGGEPIWTTSVKQGVPSAIHMWPGSSSLIAGARPTYYDPFDQSWTLKQKVGGRAKVSVLWTPSEGLFRSTCAHTIPPPSPLDGPSAGMARYGEKGKTTSHCRIHPRCGYGRPCLRARFHPSGQEPGKCQWDDD